MNAKPVLEYQRHLRSEPPSLYGPWAGRVSITIRNVSRGVIRLDEMDTIAEFSMEVLLSDGQPAPLTAAGKRVPPPGVPFYRPAISVAMVQLVPLEETTLMLDLSRRYEILPNHGYQVTLRRTRGLPKVDADGKPLKNLEVSCSFEVPEYGILR